jgi:hypothetical protein
MTIHRASLLKAQTLWLFAAILAVCLAHGQERKSDGVIENRLAGLTVGVSTLEDAKRLFGAAIRVNVPDGEADVSLSGCRLSMQVDLEASPYTTHSRIEHILLEARADSKTKECAALRTGAGLGLDSALADIERLYGKLPEQREPSGVLLSRFDYSKCKEHQKQALGMLIQWSDSDRRLKSIDIQSGSAICHDYDGAPH